MPTIHSPEYIEFIARLRNARKEQRVTQAQLASHLSKPQSFVSKVETCERRLDVLETLEWCAALGIALIDVLPSRLHSMLVHGGHQEPERGSIKVGNPT